MGDFNAFKIFLSGIYKNEPEEFILTDKLVIMYFLWLICRRLGVDVDGEDRGV